MVGPDDAFIFSAANFHTTSPLMIGTKLNGSVDFFRSKYRCVSHYTLQQRKTSLAVQNPPSLADFEPP
jgi:hypothetical protein